MTPLEKLVAFFKGEGKDLLTDPTLIPATPDPAIAKFAEEKQALVAEVEALKVEAAKFAEIEKTKLVEANKVAIAKLVAEFKIDAKDSETYEAQRAKDPELFDLLSAKFAADPKMTGASMQHRQANVVPGVTETTHQSDNPNPQPSLEAEYKALRGTGIYSL